MHSIQPCGIQQISWALSPSPSILRIASPKAFSLLLLTHLCYEISNARMNYRNCSKMCAQRRNVCNKEAIHQNIRTYMSLAVEWKLSYIAARIVAFIQLIFRSGIGGIKAKTHGCRKEILQYYSLGLVQGF